MKPLTSYVLPHADLGHDLLPGEHAPSMPPRMTAQSFTDASRPTVRVAVIDFDESTRSRLSAQMGSQVEAYASLDSLADELTGEPVVLVIGPSFGVAPGLLGAEDLIHSHSEVGAILIANELTTELFQRALRTGVRDVLAEPVDSTHLNEAVRRVAESIGANSRGGPSRTDPSDGDDQPCRVIVVFSTKGGAGKSVVASNLAVTLAQRSDKPVVLVDADLQFGDIAVMLKLAPQHTIVDAVHSIDRLDTRLLENLLVTHGPSGLRVLPAPLEPAFADQIAAADVSKIIGLLRGIAGFVVVDTPSYFDDKVLSLIEESDDILLVAGMDIPNIKNVKIGLQTMRLLNTPMSKVHLVLNQSDTKVRLDVNEVERTLQVKAESQIPSDIVVPRSINRGAPVVLDAPKSGVARALGQLADLFLPEMARKKRR